MIIEEVFYPALGLMAWSVKSGVGSFLTIEFGDPFLEVREPVLRRRSENLRVSRALGRRTVTVVGEFHLWIRHCHWHITTSFGILSDKDDLESSHSHSIFADLSGQRLIETFLEGQKSVFKFDLDGKLECLPVQPLGSEEQWTIFPNGRKPVSLLQSGLIEESCD